MTVVYPPLSPLSPSTLPITVHPSTPDFPLMTIVCLSLALALSLSHSILPTKQGVLLGQYLGAFSLMDTFRGHDKKVQ